VRRPGRGVPAALLALGVLAAAGGTPGQPALAPAPSDEAILPPASYTVPEARALAEAHAAELVAVRADLGRCPAGVALQRHGLAFRRSRGNPSAPPHLVLWVWLDGAALPRGRDPAGRGGEAFRRHGQVLLRRVLARPAVFADPRVGGYGLVLSWVGPTSLAGRPVAESLALFADKLTTANFVHETIGPAAFLARAEVRLFDGETEVPASRLVVTDDGAPTAEPC
jgi:hypothetical protein